MHICIDRRCICIYVYTHTHSVSMNMIHFAARVDCQQVPNGFCESFLAGRIEAADPGEGWPVFHWPLNFFQVMVYHGDDITSSIFWHPSFGSNVIWHITLNFARILPIFFWFFGRLTVLHKVEQSQTPSMGIPGSNWWRYVSTIFLAIFYGDIPLQWPLTPDQTSPKIVHLPSQEARSCETPPPELRIRPDPPSWSKGAAGGRNVWPYGKKTRRYQKKHPFFF